LDQRVNAILRTGSLSAAPAPLAISSSAFVLSPVVISTPSLSRSISSGNQSVPSLGESQYTPEDFANSGSLGAMAVHDLYKGFVAAHPVSFYSVVDGQSLTQLFLF
jgi:hypothetical protein